MSHAMPRPIWASLTIRLADGTTRTFEFNAEKLGHIAADVQVEADLDRSGVEFGVWRVVRSTGFSRVRATLTCDGVEVRTTTEAAA